MFIDVVKNRFKNKVIYTTLFALGFMLLVPFTVKASITSLKLPALDKSNKSSETKFSLNVGENFYIDRDEESLLLAPGSTSVLGIEGLIQKRAYGLDYKLEGQLFWSQAEKHLYIDVPSLYVEKSILGEHSVSLGRKPVQWSFDDEIWGRGLWAPRNFFKSTQPLPQALTGLLYEGFKSSPIKFNLFVSYLFIPDLGVPFEEVDGAFISKNPNFKQPTPSILLGDANIDIRYKKDIGSLNNIIFNPSVATKLFGSIGGYKLSLALAHKPINQLVLKAPLSVGTSADDAFLIANVQPNVYYHTVSTAEVVKQVNDSFLFGGSVTYDEPFVDKQPDSTLQKNIDETFIYTGFVKNSFKKIRAIGLLSYSYLNGGDLPDTGELASRTDTRFPMRYQYSNAIKFQWNQFFENWSSLNIVGEYNYDFDQKVSIIALGAKVGLFNQVELSLDYTNISLLSDKFSDPIEMYWHGLLDTDSVNVGLKYVF